MAAPIVYNDVAEGAGLNGQLFAGKKFWVAQRAPMRTRLLERIKSNGGEVVMLEKKADYLIADHFRRDCPPGSISYTFIDASVENGEIEDAENHIAGPPVGTAREVGSLSRPSRLLRTKYTAEEDRLLYKWVQDHVAQGGSYAGNEIYKQLEAKYPKHTYQSWRDHYLKQLHGRPPSAFNIPDNAPPSPPSDQSAERVHPKQPAPKPEKTAAPSRRQEVQQGEPSGAEASGMSKASKSDECSADELRAQFGHEDFEELYAYANVLLDCPARKYIKAWEEYAADNNHTASQWRQYFEKVVLPQWNQDPREKRQEIKKKMDKKHDESQKGNYDDDEMVEVAEAGPSLGDVKPPTKETEVRVKGEFEKPRRPVSHPKHIEKKTEVQLAAEVDASVLLAPRPVSTKKGKEAQVEEDVGAPGPETPKPTRKPAETPQDASRAEDPLVKQLLKERRGKEDQEAYLFYVKDRKQALWEDQPGLDHKQIHKVLMPEWDSLPEKEKTRYFKLEAADKIRYEIEMAPPPSEVRSSSTVYQTPGNIAELYTKAMKRLRGELDESKDEPSEPYHSPKRRKRETSPPTAIAAQQIDILGTQEVPLEISSGESSSEEDESQEGPDNAQLHIQQSADLLEPGANEPEVMDLVADELDSDPDMIANPQLQPIHGPLEYDEPPSSPHSPTPRAPRHRAPAFDTQAILSSPSQSLPLAGLSRPFVSIELPETQPDPFNPDERSSPTPHPHSEASTTHSIQEFRRSLNSNLEEESDEDFTLTALPRPLDLASSPSSTTSGDPDPPLQAFETAEYYELEHERGFSDAWIRAALHHTKFRPDLASVVLDAWLEGKALPNMRGVWSREDDVDLDSADAKVLERLERKHTNDGWGGTVERWKYLEQCRRMGIEPPPVV
ncbi:hypothetical protein BDV95DRAFT_575474 [Massariosphaeria phaeospora]|uniref:DNA-binding protein RAP1 n=1 Tax=Massariosphaeria phaeospora TaxID=100035 RepID=A0A7C8I3Y4_9PLEO|nr:hypothetical protein BDV95DRAFT_575474 [Massariosphaeria phaeospora]